MTSLLRPVATLGERQTTAGYVADSLRDAIRSGDLADGAELNQVALAEHFGISRVPIREALRALEGEGWISARAHRRAVVLAISPERVAEIFEVRALLEVHLIEKTIGRLEPGHAAQLRTLCDDMDALRDHHAWVAANHEFHRLLHACAGAPMTVELVEQLSSQVERYLRLHGEDVVRESEAGSEHRAILQAVEDGDVAAARTQMQNHIDHTRRRVIAAITAEKRETP